MNTPGPTSSDRRYRVHYESELNPEQLRIVMHPGGPMLALAGAGTGKTRTLVYRVSRLIEDGIPPSRILLLTFTNKAAREMLNRVEQLVDIAAVATIDQFRKRLDLEIKKIQRDDGEDRLTRQRKATRLSSWVDDEGMWNLRGRFDPVAGIKLSSKLDQAVEALVGCTFEFHILINLLGV